MMSLRERARRGLGMIEPRLPSPAEAPPRGPGWIHEIKHDGFRIISSKRAPGVIGNFVSVSIHYGNSTRVRVMGFY